MVVNRCERLDESLLPNLIEESRLNVYVDYLADRNTTLEKDFKKYYDYDFESEEFLHYVDLVEKRIKKHLNSVSEEKKSELLAGFEKQKLLAKQRRVAKSTSKDLIKEGRVKEIKDNLSGVAYKLNGRIDDFKAFSKDFKTCFAKLGANYRYFEPRIEDARNLAINCLDFLSAIRSEGFSTQNAFKEFPILEKYYKRCSLSNLEIFMNVISSGTADIKTFYTVLAKVKRELSKTD